MAVWSEVLLSKAVADNRFDAEFYQPIFVEIERIIGRRRGLPLSKLTSDIRYGLHLPPDYSDKGTTFVRALNLKEDGITGELLKVPFSPEQLGRHNILQTGDVLIVRSGANVGDIGYVSDDLAGSTFGSYVIRCRVVGILPEYAYIFLLSRLGRLQTVRFRSGAAQPNISIPNLEAVLIPRLLDDQQQKVKAKFDAALEAQRQAHEVYAEAEALLESALGLDKLDLAPRLFYDQPYADVQTAGRFDAEYFQPRMQNLIAALSRDRQTIGDVAKLSKRRFKPRAGSEFQYIEIGDVSGNGTAESSPVAGNDAPSRATWTVKPGDIITTTVRPIRRLSAIITDKQTGHVCSSGFAVLTLRNPNDIAPELLLVYLRLPLVCELLDLHTTASMYPAIATGDLIKIPLSLPKDATRQKIIAKVRDSFNARRKAQRLLDEAKTMVERAILGE